MHLWKEEHTKSNEAIQPELNLFSFCYCLCLNLLPHQIFPLDFLVTVDQESTTKTTWLQLQKEEKNND